MAVISLGGGAAVRAVSVESGKLVRLRLPETSSSSLQSFWVALNRVILSVCTLSSRQAADFSSECLAQTRGTYFFPELF